VAPFFLGILSLWLGGSLLSFFQAVYLCCIWDSNRRQRRKIPTVNHSKRDRPRRKVAVHLTPETLQKKYGFGANIWTTATATTTQKNHDDDDDHVGNVVEKYEDWKRASDL